MTKGFLKCDITGYEGDGEYWVKPHGSDNAVLVDESDLAKLHKGYRIRMLCRDSKIGSDVYEDFPSKNPMFQTREDAFQYACELAEEECAELNGADGCPPDEGVSFGIPEDDIYQKGLAVRVEQYYNEPDDDTGDTNVVTEYLVDELKYAIVHDKPYAIVHDLSIEDDEEEE